MLISHRHQFVFLRTEKTASTSLTQLLRQLCGQDEPFHVADQRVKRELLRGHGRLDNCSFIGRQGIASRTLPAVYGLHAHALARDVRAFLGPDLFDRYRVITSERNPWDRQVSLYCHRSSARGRVDLDKFNHSMQSKFYNLLHKNRTHNWDIYTIDNQVCADIVIRFEHLEQDTARMLRILGLDGAAWQLGKWKSEHRPPQTDYRSLYTKKTQELVGEWYRREIEYFGYEFAGATQEPRSPVPLAPPIPHPHATRSSRSSDPTTTFA